MSRLPHGSEKMPSECWTKVQESSHKRLPIRNLPETKTGRWGVGLTAAKMEECRWLKPVLVGQFEFAEWTPDNHLRHSRFIALREDKDARDVRREGWQEFAAVERLPIGNLKHS
jgi:ATP-dependent DNA ligase